MSGWVGLGTAFHGWLGWVGGWFGRSARGIGCGAVAHGWVGGWLGGWDGGRENDGDWRFAEDLHILKTCTYFAEVPYTSHGLLKACIAVHVLL